MYNKCLKVDAVDACNWSSVKSSRVQVSIGSCAQLPQTIALDKGSVNWKNDLQKRRKMKIHQTGKEFFTKKTRFFQEIAKIIQKPTTSQPGEPGDLLPIRGSLIFLIITFASSISALNHNCSDFTNIPAGALSLMETWSICSPILRNNRWYIHPFQSSGITHHWKKSMNVKAGEPSCCGCNTLRRRVGMCMNCYPPWNWQFAPENGWLEY